MKTKFKVLFLALFLVYSFALLSCDIQGIIDGFGTQVEKQEFTVRFMVDGRVYHTLDVSSGDKIELPKNPTKEGYEFVGWYLQDGKEFTKDIIITSNVIIVAKFEKDALKYTVTYYVDDNYYSSITVVENSKVQHPSAPYKNGYQFVGWMYNGELFNVNTLINSNIRLDACFEKVASQYYYVTYMVDDTVFGVDTYLQGEIVYAPSNPTKEGYEFVGWYLDPYYKDEVYFGTEIYSNMTVFAKFEEVKAPSNWSQNNNGYEIIEDFDEVKFVSTIDKGPLDSVYKSHQLSDSNDLCIEFSATNDTWIIFQLELFGEVYEYHAVGTGSKDSMVIGVPEHFKNQMVNFRIFIGASSYGDGYELILHGINDNQSIVNEVISVSDALMYEDGAAVVVKGIVKKIRTDWSNSYGNMSVIITDGVNDLLVFRLKTMVNVGDEVIVTGEMGTYNDQREIAEGATAEIISSNNPTQFVDYSLDIVENNLLSYEYLPDEYDLYVWAWSSTGIIEGEFYPVNNNWTFAVKEGCDRIIFVLMPTGYSPDWGYMYDQTSALVILDGTIQGNNDTYLVSYYVDGEFYYSYDVNSGDIAPEIEAPFKEGYYFESWNYLGYSWDFNNPVFENMELHATYSPLLEISGTETIQYTGEKTTNMADGDYAETLGITSGLFKITANQCSPTQNIGLNRNGQIRLYSMYSDGNELVITGKVMIKKIIISFGDRGGEFTVNGMFGSVNVSEYEINSSRVVIKNVDPSNVQLRIVSITIEYGVIEDTPTDIDGFTFNEYEDYIEITGYTGEDSDIYIPEEINGKPVTIMDGNFINNYFHNCVMSTLFFPDSLEYIEAGAFIHNGTLGGVSISSVAEWLEIKFEDVTANPLNVNLPIYIDYQEVYSVEIPYGIEKINEYAFYNFNTLEWIVIPSSVSNIGYNAFSECDNLSKVYYQGSIEDWQNVTINDGSGLDSVLYYYSETKPTTVGNYWHYIDGKPTAWPEIGYVKVDYYVDEQLYDSLELIEGSNFVEIGEPEMVGYSTFGWVDSTGRTYTSSDIINESINVYLDYSICVYQIFYESTMDISNPNMYHEYTVEDEIELLPAEKEGYVFLGWYLDPMYQNEITYISAGTTGDITLYALLETATYVATFIVDGEVYEEVEFEAWGYPNLPEGPQKEGYTFLYWAYENGTPFAPTMIGSDITLYARYEDKINFTFMEYEDYVVITDYIGTDTYVTIPAYINDKPVKVLYENAISNLNIDRIFLPWTLESIGYGALCNLNITSITIPASVNNINTSSLTGLGNLEEIIVESGNTTYTSGDGLNGIFDYSVTELIKGCKNTSIPNTVNLIKEHSFDNCELEKIVVPTSVNTIEMGAFNCPNITLYYEGTINDWPLIFGQEYVNVKQIKLSNSWHYESGKPVDNLEVNNCYYYIENNITHLEGIINNGNSYIIIPVSIFESPVKVIDGGALDDAYGYSIYYEGTLVQWLDVIVLNYNYNYNPDAVYYYSEERPAEEGTTWCYVDGIPTIWSEVYPFEYNEYEDYIEITGYNGKDELVEIPSEINSKPVTRIADKAFVNCQFKELLIPESIISIGKEILVGCNQLESLTTPLLVMAIMKIKMVLDYSLVIILMRFQHL